MRCAIAWLDRSSGIAYDAQCIQTVVDAALAKARRTRCSLTVLIVDARESARLHRQHFAVAGATDVMTFPDGTRDPDSGRRHLGDLAVCASVAKREARRRRRSDSDELTLYVLHGLLHLLGYDDRTPRDLLRMWTAQRRLLQTVGIDLEPSPG